LEQDPSHSLGIKEVVGMKLRRKQTATVVPTLNEEALHDRIEKKAYERYLDRGQLDGYDLDDWLEAEQLVLAELGEESGEKD
jgi:hypothetical protein